MNPYQNTRKRLLQIKTAPFGWKSINKIFIQAPRSLLNNNTCVST